jgi:hypothetical protein
LLYLHSFDILSMEVQDIECIDCTLGGDHGKSGFRMILKLILRCSNNKPPFYKLFQIASDECSKDDIAVLCQNVLDPIGASLKQMMDGGGLFVLHKSNDDIVTVQ